MTQSTAIRDAAERLQRALRSLEVGLEPLIKKVDDYNRVSAEAKDCQTDRSDLVNQLDEAKAREAEFSKRENEFSQLAKESRRELDAVISEVMSALGGGE